MATYSYVARDTAGRKMKGVVSATDEIGARTKLKHIGVYVTSLSRIPGWMSPFYAQRIQTSEILIVSEELSAMLEAGISVGRALDVLAHQTNHSTFRRVLIDVREDVHRGQSLADALSAHPEVFSSFYVQLVRVGETSGQLDSMLLRIVEHLESEREMRRKVISAFAYPGFVLLVSAVVIAVLMVFVMPKFQMMYTQLGAVLPWTTRALIGLSYGFRDYGWMVLVGLAGGLLALSRFRNHAKVRGTLDSWKLRIPFIGSVLQKSLTTKFLHIFAVLINSGVPMMDSLTLLESTSHNEVIAGLIRRLQIAVNRGHQIADSLAKDPLLPPVAVQMVAAGEESGDLGSMLSRASDFLRREVDISLKRMINSLGPALTIVLALIVAGIVLSIYLPIFEITSRLGR